jgi:hypothetical protein
MAKLRSDAMTRGRVPGPDQGSVFLAGDVADPVEPVLDLPVAADPCRHGGGLGLAVAGDEVDDDAEGTGDGQRGGAHRRACPVRLHPRRPAGNRQRAGYLVTWAARRAGYADQAGPGFLGVVGEGVPRGTRDERCQRSPRQFALPPCNDVAGMSDVIGSVAH